MSLNKLMLIGHVGKDPDIRILEAGSKVATFSFATTEKGYTLANGTQVPERTEWQIVLGRWWRWRALIHRTSSLIIGVFRKRWRWWRLLRLNRKHLHIINKKFCNIPFNSSAIIITPSSYLSFQIQLVSLMDILLNNIGKTSKHLFLGRRKL